jgi:hypothetical protein
MASRLQSQEASLIGVHPGTDLSLWTSLQELALTLFPNKSSKSLRKFGSNTSSNNLIPPSASCSGKKKRRSQTPVWESTAKYVRFDVSVSNSGAHSQSDPIHDHQTINSGSFASHLDSDLNNPQIQNSNTIPLTNSEQAATQYEDLSTLAPPSTREAEYFNAGVAASTGEHNYNTDCDFMPYLDQGDDYVDAQQDPLLSFNNHDSTLDPFVQSPHFDKSHPNASEAYHSQDYASLDALNDIFQLTDWQNTSVNSERSLHEPSFNQGNGQVNTQQDPLPFVGIPDSTSKLPIRPQLDTSQLNTFSTSHLQGTTNEEPLRNILSQHADWQDMSTRSEIPLHGNYTCEDQSPHTAPTDNPSPGNRQLSASFFTQESGRVEAQQNTLPAVSIPNSTSNRHMQTSLLHHSTVCHPYLHGVMPQLTKRQGLSGSTERPVQERLENYFPGGIRKLHTAPTDTLASGSSHIAASFSNQEGGRVDAQQDPLPLVNIPNSSLNRHMHASLHIHNPKVYHPYLHGVMS